MTSDNRAERLKDFLNDDLGRRARGQRFLKQRRSPSDHVEELRLWAIWRDIKLAHPRLTEVEKQDIGVAIRAAFILGKEYSDDLHKYDCADF